MNEKKIETPGTHDQGSPYVRDFVASIVVFLVALPLCMGIALASGVPPALGLITGIIGGLIVGTISGSPLQVSGPAAGLAVIVWELVDKKGLDRIGMIVLICGLIQVVAGLLKLGQWFRAVAPSVIQGMLAGIGVLIFAGQFHVMIDDKPRGSGITNLLSIPEAIYKAIFPMDGSSHQAAALTGVATILALVLWQTFKPKKLKAVPGALIGVLVAVAGSAIFGLSIKHVTVPDNLLDAMIWTTPSSFLEKFEWSLLASGAAMALIASAETLLSASAVDQMHSGPRAQYDRELFAQGVGNTLCGVVGALPMTGVIVRSATNVDAGARSRMSTILHGGWLLGTVALAPFALERIPTSSLAAVLVFTGYKLVNPAAIKKLASLSRSEVLIYAATLIGIVCTDLLTGVLIGVGLSVAKLVWTRSHIEVRLEEGAQPEMVTVRLRGAATFMRLPKIAAVLSSVKAKTTVSLNISELDYIDAAVLDLISGFEKQHVATGGKVIVDWDELRSKFPSKKWRRRGVERVGEQEHATAA